jgi:hypothetical protein
VTEPGDRPYGLRDFQAKDLHGYRLAFGTTSTMWRSRSRSRESRSR